MERRAARPTIDGPANSSVMPRYAIEDRKALLQSHRALVKDTIRLTPSKGKWIQNEYADLQTQLNVDLGILLNMDRCNTDG